MKQGRHDRQVTGARGVIAQSRQDAIMEHLAGGRQPLLDSKRFVRARFSIGPEEGNDLIDLLGDSVEPPKHIDL